MKKILFVIHDLAQGGAEKVLVNLVNNMNKDKYDVTVMTLFDVGVNKQFLDNDIKYKSCFKKMIRGNSHIMKLLTPKQLFKWLVKDEYDIIVSYLEGPTARVVSGCDKEYTKLVSWIHVEQHTVKKACKSFRSYKEAKMCYEKFDNTVCVSKSVLEDFQNIFHLHKPIEVLYNTNESEKIRELSQKPVTETTFQESEIKICGIGKIIPVKGFDRLARIHSRLIEEGFPVHTYILGTGEEQKKIENYIEEKQLGESFTFLGYQTNPYKFVEKCDLFVCCSFAEGFSTAATEALIVGTPVVTTLVAGMEEMLGKNNEYGIITQNDEEHLYRGIRQMIQPEVLSYYTRQAKIRGSFFSTEKTVQAVQQMFENLYNIKLS